MEHIELKTTKREILGKKVRFLRRQGITPVHLFGHGIESMALQCDTTELHRALAKAGHTSLISLKLPNEKVPRNVIVQEIQTEPCTRESLHVDFYQVRMAEVVRMEVPVVLVGEAPALKLKENMLVQALNSLSVECLPANTPASITLDLSTLTEPNQAIRVRDIESDKGITVLNNPELVIVSIGSRPVEKIEEEAMAAEAIEVPGADSLNKEELTEG
ncbi:50S ribosomal protein L25 [Chloroflexota bacterium]